jgi:hypothetical protein
VPVKILGSLEVALETDRCRWQAKSVSVWAWVWVAVVLMAAASERPAGPRPFTATAPGGSIMTGPRTSIRFKGTGLCPGFEVQTRPQPQS